jgi:hypothetical protein
LPTRFGEGAFEQTAAGTVPTFHAKDSGKALHLIYDSGTIFQAKRREGPASGIDGSHGALWIDGNRDFGIAAEGDFQNLLGLTEKKAHTEPYRSGSGKFTMRANELPK